MELFRQWGVEDAIGSRGLVDFDKNLVLVAGPAADGWLEAGPTVAGRLGIPLEVRRLPTADTSHGFEMGPRGAALVPPDGHVAFRMPWTPSDPARELAAAIATILR
jgi:putative polyketide hydroxylase/tetracenomycin A2 monooxygenase-dioxygenase